MTVLGLLITLRDLGVTLTPWEDRLRVDAPTGVLTDDLVAPHLTVAWFACKENGGPGILLWVRSPTSLGGYKHGPHNNILPQCGVPRQRPNGPGQHWYPFAEGETVPL